MTGLLLASIHDVSPRFESEVDRLVEVLQPHVGDRIAMLVVPNHWGSAPIVPGSPFAARLRRWSEAGFEMFLHGFYHRDDHRHTGADGIRARLMTNGEGEFLGLSRAQARERIERGRSLVEDLLGAPIAGFVAPAWLYGRGAVEALEDCDIPIAESHWRVWSPATGRDLSKGPVITWASRTPSRLASSLAAAAVLRHSRSRVLRIGVHPPDVRHPRLVKSIQRALAAGTKARRAAGYSALLKTS